MNRQNQQSFPWTAPWFRILSTVLVLAIMIGLFVFSHQGQWASEKTSEPLAQVIVQTGVARSEPIKQIIEPVIHTDEELPVEQQAQQIARKLGHILIFGALGFWLFLCLKSWFPRMNPRWLFFLSLLIGILYGASDEFHQSFVPARSAEWHDVFVDAIGVIIGVALALWAARWIDARGRGRKTPMTGLSEKSE